MECHSTRFKAQIGLSRRDDNDDKDVNFKRRGKS